jgi:hypothetical protein
MTKQLKRQTLKLIALGASATALSGCFPLVAGGMAGGALVIAILSVRQLTDWGKLTGMIWLGVMVFAVYFAYYFAYSSLDLRILRTYRARKLEKKH